MRIVYDYFKNVEETELFLCNPTYETVGAIQANDRQVTLRFNDLSELTFTALQNKKLWWSNTQNNGKDNSYDLIQKNRLVYATNIGWFVIDSVSETIENDYKTKAVSCKSLQCAIGNRGVVSEDRIYKFYNTDDPTDKYYDDTDAGQSPSIVGQMVQQLGVALDIKDSYYTPSEPYDDWTLCYVPQSLRFDDENTVVRSMDKEVVSGYDFLANKASDAFKVVFDFDFLNKCINVLTEEDVNEVTNVCLSFQNFMKNMNVTEDSDGLVTVMEVNGSDIDVRAVNPLGTNYILDFSYFMEGVALSSYSALEINQDVFRAKAESLSLPFDTYTFSWDNSVKDYSVLISGVRYYARDFGIIVNDDPLESFLSFTVIYKSPWMSKMLVQNLKDWQNKVDAQVTPFANLTLKLRNAYLAKLEAQNGIATLSKSLQDLQRASDNRTEALSRSDTKLHGIITAELVEKTKNSMYPNSKFYPGNSGYVAPFSGTETLTLHQNPPNNYDVTTGKFSWSGDSPKTVTADKAFEWGNVAEGYRYFQDDTHNSASSQNQKSYCRLEGGVKLNIDLDWSTTGPLTISINRQTWRDYIKNNAGTYTFTYLDGVWKYGSTTTVNLSDYGISYKGTPNSGDSITVVYSYADEPECYCSGFTRFADYDLVDNWIEILSWNVSAGNAEIDKQQAIIDDCKAKQKEISDSLNIFAFFADVPGYAKELGYYWIEGSYDDEHIASLDSTSPEEEIKLALELYENGKAALAKACRPKYTFSCDLAEAMTSYEFANQVNNIELGKIIQVERSDTVWYYPALLEISYSLDNAGDFKMTFSDRLKLEDFGLTFADMIGRSATVSKQVVASWQDLTDYSNSKQEIQEKINNPLDATLRAGIANAINQEIVIDNTGLIGRKFKTFPDGVNYKGSVEYYNDLFAIQSLQVGDVYTVLYQGESGSVPDGSMYVCLALPPEWSKFETYLADSYEPEQVRLMNNLLIFTDDNWQSAKLALGKITLPGTQTQAYGLIAEYLIGQVLLGNTLTISNGDSTNTVAIDENGITIKHNGSNMFLVDSSTGNAMFNGTIYAANGEFGGQLTAASGTFTGTLRAADGEFSGALSAKGGSISNTLSTNTLSSSRIESKDIITRKIQINGVNLTRTMVGGTSTTETAVFTYDDVQSGAGETLVTINALEDIAREPLPLSSNQTLSVTYISVTLGVTVTKSVIMVAGTSSVSLTFPYYASDQTVSISPSSVTVQTGTSGTSMITLSHPFCPSIDNTYNLGNSSYMWHEVWANSGVKPSDRNKKKDISYDMEEFNGVFDKLRPCSYRFKDDPSKKHFGFIAQDIEDTLEENGYSPDDYAIIHRGKNDDGNGEYHGMSYDELHALEVAQIQKLLAVIEEQNKHIKEIEAKLNQLTDK